MKLELEMFISLSELWHLSNIHLNRERNERENVMNAGHVETLDLKCPSNCSQVTADFNHRGS